MSGPIVIDPGHGGQAPAGRSTPYGTRGPSGLSEKDVVLDLARRVAAHLGQGRAMLTRSGDINLPLGERTAIAQRHGAPVFLSLHANQGNGQGAEAYVHPRAAAASHALASAITAELARFGGRSPQVTSEEMAVLSPERLGHQTAACLLEVDYLSTRDGEQRLRDPRSLDHLSRAIANGVQRYMGGGYGQRMDRGEEFISPDLTGATGIGDILSRVATMIGRQMSWTAGVPDTTIFPFSAVCQLLMSDAAGNQYYGTGFYIGNDKILSCGHNFYESDGSYNCTSVLVQPGHDPIRTTFAERTFTVNGRDLVHPNWRSSGQRGYDLSVLHVPGLPAPNGRYFTLPNMCPVPQDYFVVGFGKVDGSTPQDQQPMRCDGGPVISEDTDLINYAVNTKAGNSGSPVFINNNSGMVLGVHTGPSYLYPNRANRGVYIGPDKLDWINGM
jgi:V8-like Glu-specific endopeptidase